MVKEKKDSIDYSDIPATDEKFWEGAKVYFPQKKQSLTIRLDAEIVEWFKQNGSGYQTHINAVLKAYVLSRHNLQKPTGRKTTR